SAYVFEPAKGHLDGHHFLLLDTKTVFLEELDIFGFGQPVASFHARPVRHNAVAALESSQRLDHPFAVEQLGFRRLCAIIEGGIEGESAVRSERSLNFAQDLLLLRHEVDGVAEEDRIYGFLNELRKLVGTSLDEPDNGILDVLKVAAGCL